MLVEKVWELMKSWEHDPCWDLEVDAYDTKYAPYRQILLDFVKSKRTEWEEYCKYSCKPKDYHLSKANFDCFIEGKDYLLIKRVVFEDSYNEIYLTPQSTKLLVKVNNDERIIEISNCVVSL